ncbi:MAG: hypothetical protein K2G63_01565 [Oscillospiraceae bacterium]|nr:hypothetical protein [Oscillospiraceae bacterium]
MTDERNLEKDFRDIDNMGVFPEDIEEDESNDGFSFTGNLGDVDDDLAEIMKTNYAKILQNNILTSDNEIMQISDNFSGLQDISDAVIDGD